MTTRGTDALAYDQANRLTGVNFSAPSTPDVAYTYDGDDVRVRSSTGTGSLFGFTGEQTDAETGFVFLRTRYRDLTAWRFVRRDSAPPYAPATRAFAARARRRSHRWAKTTSM